MNNKSYANSLLDRLLDELPQSEYERVQFNQYGLTEYKRAVFSDVSVLLNTRSVLDVNSFLNSELTVYHFGIPDMSHFVAGNYEQQRLFPLVLEHAIERFEKRLTKVQVTLLPVKFGNNRFKAQIKANLRLIDEEINVSFLTVNEISRQGWTIHESNQQ